MLSLDENERAELWQKLTAEVENHFRQVEKLPVAPKNKCRGNPFASRAA